MAPTGTYNGTGVQYFEIPDFNFVNGGGEKHEIKVAYRVFNEGKEDTVLIPTCYGGKINTTLNFSTSALKNYRVIVVAMLGNGESTSPSNDPTWPSSVNTKGLRYADCINAQHALVTFLGIKQPAAVIGFSMGGQQAYHWAAMHALATPPFVRAIIPICSSAKTSAHNIAFIEGPVGALSASIDYADNTYAAKNVVPVRGLHAFGRAYAAWLTSGAWFRQKLWRAVGAESLEAWLEARGKGYESWDANNLLVLVRMWQSGDISGKGRSVEEVLGDIKCKALVMPCRTDQYFAWEDSVEEVKNLKNGELEIIESVWGHLAGSGVNPEDVKFMDERIGRFLESI